MKKQILVIEDNELNQEILQEILSDSYEVILAGNGREGLDVLEARGRKISLILLDIQMPVMNGYEFLEEIRKKPYYMNIPIIVMTSSDSASDEIRCLEAGASDFVTKPYNPDIVLTRVESMIRLSEASAMLNKVEYDSLTGVYSKEFFFSRAERLLESYPDEEFDVVCTDIDSFKMINDRYGVEKGDKMLKYLAEQLKGWQAEKSVVGRISGDIFAVICPHTSLEEHSRQMQILMKQIAEGPIANITICFGVYMKVSRTLPMSTICDNALLAIDGIKHRYGTKIAAYDESVRQRLQREQRIQDDMETALSEKQFKVYFQIKHNLAENKMGGAEALVRWIHPELGFMNPGEFIPLFEKNGFITKLDQFVLWETCRLQKEWREEGYPVIPISVNISRVDFEQKDLADVIRDIVDGFELSHDLIHLEVTESAYTENPDRVAEVVGQLKDEGFRVELDDFGTGYSSFNVLNEMSLDVLKLDMSMVQNMSSDTQKTILFHILAMAQDLNMEVVAEGVETQDEAGELKRMGCTYAQGYYYSRPLPKEEFEKYMRNHQEEK